MLKTDDQIQTEMAAFMEDKFYRDCWLDFIDKNKLVHHSAINLIKQAFVEGCGCGEGRWR